MMTPTPGSTRKGKGWIVALSIMGCAATAFAGPRDRAYKIYNRLNGVPPSQAVLDQMESQLKSGDAKAAALSAINDEEGSFYELTLKNMVSKWTNVDRTPRVDLNDYVATVIGMVRDDVPFNQVLTGDIVYTGDVAGAPAYSFANNDHYTFLEDNGSRLREVLVQQQQSVVSPLPADATAGVMTTRGFAEAYYKAGTNRRAVAFTMDTFFCRSMEQLADTTRPDTRIRRDVSRKPGGDSALFRNRCSGCHSGMDALAGAFAYYDWEDTDPGTFIYTPGEVRPKFNRNAGDIGHTTEDDSWINFWNEGQNANFGWHGADQGNGAKELGRTLANTDQFSRCMARRSYQNVCLSEPQSKAEKNAIKDLAKQFRKDDAYNMKQLFADTATRCIK